MAAFESSPKPEQKFIRAHKRSTFFNKASALFLFAQDHPEQLRIIQTPVDGRNALDFVLTLELGRIIAADSEGYFHIVSRDPDFDSVVRHLKSETKLITRHSALAEIPALRTPKERIDRLKTELADATKPRPSTGKTLENKIKSAFENKAEPEFIAKTIKAFVHGGILGFTGTDRVNYSVVRSLHLA